MTAYDSIERDAADVVERRHRRTFTLTQLLVACVAACCCALAATTVRSTHHEGWFIRIRRPAPRPVHSPVVSRLVRCKLDLKAQKDENEKHAAESKAALKASEKALKASEEKLKASEEKLEKLLGACIQGSSSKMICPVHGPWNH